MILRFLPKNRALHSCFSVANRTFIIDFDSLCYIGEINIFKISFESSGSILTKLDILLKSGDWIFRYFISSVHVLSSVFKAKRVVEKQ